MQLCTSPQTDNHTSTPPLSFLQAGCPSATQPTASKHIQEKIYLKQYELIKLKYSCPSLCHSSRLIKKSGVLPPNLHNRNSAPGHRWVLLPQIPCLVWFARLPPYSSKTAPQPPQQEFCPWTPLGSSTSDPMSSLIRSLASLFQQNFPRYCGILAWLTFWGEVQILYVPAVATATHYLLLQ